MFETKYTNTNLGGGLKKMPAKTTLKKKEARKIVSPARPEGGAGGRGGCLPGMCPAETIDVSDLVQRL